MVRTSHRATPNFKAVAPSPHEKNNHGSKAGPSAASATHQARARPDSAAEATVANDIEKRSRATLGSAADSTRCQADAGCGRHRGIIAVRSGKFAQPRTNCGIGLATTGMKFKQASAL